ncbi:hypothetical protein AB0N19_37510, partial [Streptomyces sp. NPDC051132]
AVDALEIAIEDGEFLVLAPTAGALVWGGVWLVRDRLIRRRMAEWDEEWKRIGPRWGNLSGGRG